MLLERKENRKIQKVAKLKLKQSEVFRKKYLKENNQNQNYLSHKSHQKGFGISKLNPKQILFVTETNKVKKANLRKVLSFELLKSKNNFRSDFLKKHKISPEIRARMVF